jgi:hypothetical protein
MVADVGLGSVELAREGVRESIATLEAKCVAQRGPKLRERLTRASCTNASEEPMCVEAELLAAVGVDHPGQPGERQQPIEIRAAGREHLEGSSARVVMSNLRKEVADAVQLVVRETGAAKTIPDGARATRRGKRGEEGVDDSVEARASARAVDHDGGECFAYIVTTLDSDHGNGTNRVDGLSRRDRKALAPKSPQQLVDDGYEAALDRD